MAMVDVVVVGCGPAGATLAALLATRGVSVVVLEKSTFPRDKLCGEFLSTETLALLERAGCRDAILAQSPARMTATRFTGASGVSFTSALPGTALGLSRFALDTVLMEHARARGANIVTAATVTKITRANDDFEVMYRKEDIETAVRARFVVGSHGRRTRLDRTLARPFAAGTSPFFGFKAHQRVSDDTAGQHTRDALNGTVEVHCFSGGYCGLALVEAGAVNACMLLDKRRLVGKVDWLTVREEITKRNPALAARFAGLRDDGSEVQAVAQIPFVMKEQHRDGVFFVGDAAGMIAPVAGDGQAMAIDSAHLLAPILLTALTRSGDDGTRQWQSAWRQRYRTRLRVGLALQTMLLREGVADHALRLASTFPALGRAFIAYTRGD